MPKERGGLKVLCVALNYFSFFFFFEGIKMVSNVLPQQHLNKTSLPDAKNGPFLWGLLCDSRISLI